MPFIFIFSTEVCEHPTNKNKLNSQYIIFFIESLHFFKYIINSSKRKEVTIDYLCKRKSDIYIAYFNRLSPVISAGIGNPNNCKIVGAKSPNFPSSFKSKCVFVTINGTRFVV